MYNCSVPGCRRSYGDWSRARSPLGPRPVLYCAKKAERRSLWEAAIKATEQTKRIKEWQRGMAICDIHFKPDDYMPWYTRSLKVNSLPPHLQNVKLKLDAVPSLYLDQKTNEEAKKKLKAKEWAWWELIPQDSNANSSSSLVIKPKLRKCIDLDPNVSQTSSESPNFTVGDEHSAFASEIGQYKEFDISNDNDDLSETSQLSTFVCSNSNLNYSEFSSDVGYSVIDTNPEVEDYDEFSNPVNDLEHWVREEGDRDNSNSTTLSACSDNFFEVNDSAIFKQKNIGASHLINFEDNSPNYNYKAPSPLTEQKIKLFRQLCSTPLKLPSHLWAVHYHSDNKYLIICKVSFDKGFSVDRGLRFTPDISEPDVYVGGRKIIQPDMKTLDNISDIERFIHVIDNLVPCPGSGLQSLPFSKSCLGGARPVPFNASGIIPCVACNTLKLSHLMKEKKNFH